MENLLKLKSEVSSVVVVDNGSENLPEPAQGSGVLVLRNERNLGIAAALNVGIRYAIEQGYRWVATFDQDSTVTVGYTEAMLAGFEACPYKERVALIAPVLCMSLEESERLRHRESDRAASSAIRSAMTSGTLLRTDIFAKAGFYDETLFMDYVDYDFCLRLQKLGWRLIRAHEAHLIHRLGVAEPRSVLGLKRTTKTHNAWRRYYIMRNRVLVYRRYGFSFPLWCLNDIMWIFLELTKILAFEEEKGAKVRNMLKGLADGLAGRTGER
jgi:rhamnosyltransferase